MTHFRSKTSLTIYDHLRGRPTRIQHGLRSNVDCLSLSSSPSPPPASFPCRRPYSAPSLLRRRGQRAPRGCRPRAPVARAHAAAAPRARRGPSACYLSSASSRLAGRASPRHASTASGRRARELRGRRGRSGASDGGASPRLRCATEGAGEGECRSPWPRGGQA